MDRKSFLGRFLALMAAPKLIKEDNSEPLSIQEAKDYLKLEGFAEHEDLKNMKPFTFRDLVSKTRLDGSEFHFVRYRETKTSGLIT